MIEHLDHTMEVGIWALFLFVAGVSPDTCGCRSQGCSQFARVDRLEHSSIGPGPACQEVIRAPVEEKDRSRPVVIVGCLANRADDSHPTLGPHLHVDDDRIEARPLEPVGYGAWVVEHLDLPCSDREGGADFVDHPRPVGYDQS